MHISYSGDPVRRIHAVALAFASVLLVGCQASGRPTDATEQSAGSPHRQEAPLAGLLPDKYQRTGVIRVGIDSIPPLVYPEGGRTVGVEVDLTAALGKLLGVTFEFEHADFSELIGGLQSQRFDLAMSGIHDTRQRRQGVDGTGADTGPGVDFVRYFTAGTSVVVRKGRGQSIASPADVCGRKVAVQQGTTVEEAALKQGRTCKAVGKPDIVMDKYETHKEVLESLERGRADAAMMDYPSASYTANQAPGSGAFEVAGGQMDPKPYGIALPKGADRLREAVQSALKSVIDSGEYTKILKKWRVADGALRTSGG